MTAAVPDPRFRDQLAEALWQYDTADDLGLRGHSYEHTADALMPVIAAEVEARVQAAANQRAVERQWASETAWIEGYEACRRGDQLFRNPYRAAALAPPAPAPRAEEGQADVMPEGWIDADWTHYS